MNLPSRVVVSVLTLVVVFAGCSSDPSDSPTNGPDGSTPSGGDDGGGGADSSMPVACGRLTTPCGIGGTCEGAPDCQTMVCFKGTCQMATPADGIKDGNETDVDCGGSSSPACADGKGCLVASDCTSDVCTGGKCQAPSPTDGVKNGDETDVDCGGAKAPKCATGKGCSVTADCDAATCDPTTKKCLPPSHTDGIKNDGETGVDCGGTAPTKCPTGEGCAVTADCNNVLCNTTTLKCDPPSATDGLKNGTETDIDCGGGAPTNAPACAVGLTCGVDTDCGSTACNYNKKCVESVSCKVQHGGDTCGPTGTDSCCKSLPVTLPNGTTVNLDKFNITAGRMRAFVASLGAGGNMRAWLMAHTPAGWPSNWTNQLPTMLDNGGTDPDYTGIYQELGPNVHPPSSVGANEGCFIDNFGARTYRLPDAVNARMADPQYYTQDFLDDRALNCVPVAMLAAMCAWDGGTLASKEAIDAAWGAGTYPWADQTSKPLGYQFAIGTDPKGSSPGAYGGFQGDPKIPAPFTAAQLIDLSRTNYNYNYWGGAKKPDPPAEEDFSGKHCTQLEGAAGKCGWRDYSIFIAPPGRFPNGDSATGHSDLAGSVFNTVYPKSPNVADGSGNADSSDYLNGQNVHWSRSGSWQGHNIPWTGKKSWMGAPSYYKYWAMGGRCIH